MDKIEIIRHSLSHIMAQVVQELYPGTKFGIGPSIENGFYYDFALPSEALAKEGLSLGDLPKIEKRMKELVSQNISFKKIIVSKEEARKIFKDQPYKLELVEEVCASSPPSPRPAKARRDSVIEELPGKTVSIYESGNFIDLCRGPHVRSAKEITQDAFRLTKIAGAYWRGSEKNPMLTRIYGLAFQTKKELENYFKVQEEAEKRDHRFLGQKLDLFHIDENVGTGLSYGIPKERF